MRACRRSAESLLVSCTGATSSMYGLSSLAAASRSTRRTRSLQHRRARTAGSDSRNLIFRFITDCIVGLRGVAEDAAAARAPAGRTPCGPGTSRRPSPRASSSATYVAQSRRRRRGRSVMRAPARRGTSRSPSSVVPGPSSEPRCAVAAAVRLRGLLEQLMPDEQRRAQRAAGVARGRLNPDVLERPLAQDAAVADAVERHAAGQAQVLHARSARARAARIRSMTSSVTAWIDAARSISRW